MNREKRTVMHCVAYKWVPAPSDDKLCIHHSYTFPTNNDDGWSVFYAISHNGWPEHFANIVFKWKLNTFLITDKWRYATPKCSNVLMYEQLDESSKPHQKISTVIQGLGIIASLHIPSGRARWFACVHTSWQHKCERKQWNVWIVNLRRWG